MIFNYRLVFLILFFSWSNYGQDFNFNFRNISVKNGLSHSDVTSVTQDDEGFLWIGTLAGINKYDGYELKTFSNKNFLLESVYKNRTNKLFIKNNYLWIATKGGVDCFNIVTEGYVKISWELIDATFHSNAEVLSVFVSPLNNLYVITETGMKVFNIDFSAKNKISLKEIELDRSWKNVIFSDIQIDEKGQRWLISENGLYYLSESKRYLQIKKIDVLVNKSKVSGFLGLYTKDKNNILLGMERGFIRVNTASFNSIKNSKLSGALFEINNPLINKLNSFNTRFTVNLFEKGLNNSIWLGSSYGLIECVPNKDTYLYNFYNSNRLNLSKSAVVSLFKDKSGCLWMSNYQGGINYTDLFQKKFYSLKYDQSAKISLTESYVRAITEDQFGNIWIGTEKSGLSYFNFKTNTITHFKHNGSDPKSLLSDGIRSLLIDDYNRLWVGTVDGISIYFPDKKRFFNITKNGPEGKNLSNNVIFSLVKDNFGNIWAGSWQNGLNRIGFINETNFSVEKIYAKTKENVGLSSNIVTFILTDNFYPELLVGTDKGLNHVYLNEKGKIDKVVNYIGNQGKKNTLSSNFIWPIVRENDSVIWVGTLGGGLNKLTINHKLKQGYKATVFSIDEGAPSNDIESILFDKENNHLWLGGAGLSKFDVKTNQFINYDEDDGLVGNSFKVGASHKGKSGRFYFGSTDGLTFFYPNQIVENTYRPKIILTDLLINNKIVKFDENSSGRTILSSAINFEKNFEINYLENNIQIHFSSDHFANSGKTKFKYKLIGYNEDWVFVEAKNRKASFTNLPYGSYVFQVTGTNSDGVWTNDIKSIKFKVLAPWWYTKTAKIGYVFIAILILFIGFLAIVRWFKLKKAYEISVLEEQQKEQLYQLRAEFFTNVSHEFKTPLTLILNPLEKLIDGENVIENQRKAYYQLMQKNAKRLLTLINELIDYRKVSTNIYKIDIQENDLSIFMKDLEDFFNDDSKKESGNIVFKNLLESNLFQFDRIVLEKIMFNIIGNAIKFSPNNSNVIVSISNSPCEENSKYENKFEVQSNFTSENYIYISIEDEGVGIDENQISYIFDRFFQNDRVNNSIGGSGIGLTLVKSLVELHKAKLTVYSTVNVGTRFVLQLPDIDYSTIFPEMISVRLVKLSTSNYKSFEHNSKSNEPIYNLHENIIKPEILLVEDNTELRSFIKDDFQDFYNVREASNGIEALKVLGEHKIQIIISDIMMPEMDGIELCKRVKESPIYRRIPLILLTAKYQIESQIEGIQSGADVYISKPFSLEFLKLNVANILKSRKELKENIIENSFAEARLASEENSDDEFLRKLMDTIDDNIEDVDFDVEKLSQILGVSKSTLYTLVKTLTSKSIGGLIRSVRLKKAAQLLASSDLNAIQVMEKVGIQSQSHFTKSFRKEFGVTPSQFIKNLGSN